MTRELGKILLTALCIIIVLWVISTVVLRRPLVTGGQPTLPMQQITIGSTTVAVEVATTSAQEEAGLSNRSALPQGQGMLFIFNPPSSPGFWMKDMRFSLDIIFADEQGVINTIYPNLSPSTYPQAFYPASPSAYVLEVPAGFAAAHNIAVGQKIVVQ